MASRDAQDELDAILDALVQALPPERHQAIRALLRPSRESRPHQPAAVHPPAPTPDQHASDNETPPPSQPSLPAAAPPLTPERAARIADDVILAAMRAAGATAQAPLSPPSAEAPLSLRTGPGTPWVAVRGEGRSTAGDAHESPLSRLRRERGLGGGGPKTRIAVRPDREPLGHTVRLSDVAPEPLRWLWPGRIPVGKITVLDGDPGLGKSTLLCEIAARLSRGQPLPGDAASEPTEPRGVLLFSAEDDVFDTIRPRIDAAGGDPSRIAAFVAIPDGSETGRPFALPRDLPILEAIVQRLDAALVIIDPLVAFLRPGVSATNEQHVRHALGSLKAAAERSGAAIVVVRHLTKSAGANPLYRGAGSIGIIAAARSGLLLAADPDDPERRILAVGKGNLARPAPALAFRLEDVPGATVARVVWDGESPWTATQLLHGRPAAEGDATRSVIDEARLWLRETLAAGPRLAKELRDEARERGIGRSALYAARKAEGITIAKERTTYGRWIWFFRGSSGERERERTCEGVGLPGS